MPPMLWAPEWLGRAYCILYAAAGNVVFTLDEALLRLQVSRERGRVILSELAKRGYLNRVSRGCYAARSPSEVVLGVTLGPARVSLKQRVYEPLLDEVLRGLFERFRQNLVSVVLYGSIARGVPQSTSDMDLLVVIRGLPPSFHERTTTIGDILRGVHGVKMGLWKSSGRYANVDILPFTPEEASVLRPLYLDFLFDAIIVYDQGGFMHQVLERLRNRIQELGARRITMPSGKWYWSLAQASAKRSEISL